MHIEGLLPANLCLELYFSKLGAMFTILKISPATVAVARGGNGAMAPKHGGGVGWRGMEYQ